MIPRSRRQKISGTSGKCIVPAFYRAGLVACPNSGGLARDFSCCSFRPGARLRRASGRGSEQEGLRMGIYVVCRVSPVHAGVVMEVEAHTLLAAWLSTICIPKRQLHRRLAVYKGGVLS